MPPPSNDNFVDAEELVGTSGSIGPYAAEDATDEVDEPAGSNGSGTPSQTRWWKITATEHRLYTIDTHGSDLDTQIAVWQGTEFADLVEVVSNDDSEDLTSEASFEVLEGEIYYLQIGTYSADSGNMLFNWTSLSLPAEGTFTKVGDDLGVSPVNIDGFGGYLGRDGDVPWFAWFDESGGPDGPWVSRFLSGAWERVGTDSVPEDLGLDDSGDQPITDNLYVLWRGAGGSDQLYAGFWNGSAWTNRTSGLPGADYTEFAVAFDADDRLCVLTDELNIYRWNGASFAVVGDPFPGYWPSDGDGYGFTGSLIAHPTDPDKLAVVVGRTDSDGVYSVAAAVTVFFFDDGTWSEGVVAPRDDDTLFELPGGSLGTYHTCQATVDPDGLIYIASSYERNGSLHGTVSVITLPWDGSTYSPFPAPAPANRPTVDPDLSGDTIYLDTATIPTIAINEDGWIAVAYTEQGDPTYPPPTIAYSNGGGWGFAQPDEPQVGYYSRVQVIPGSRTLRSANAFLIGFVSEDVNLFRVWEFALPEEDENGNGGSGEITLGTRLRIERLALYRVYEENETGWNYVQVPDVAGKTPDIRETFVDQNAFSYEGVGFGPLSLPPP